MGPIGCPETSVNNYHTTLRNIPEERSSRVLIGFPRSMGFCLNVSSVNKILIAAKYIVMLTVLQFVLKLTADCAAVRIEADC